MAYKRKYSSYKKRRFTPKRKYKRSYGGTRKAIRQMGLGKTLSNRRTEGTIGIERKYLDFSFLSQDGGDETTRSQLIENFAGGQGSPALTAYKNPGTSVAITNVQWQVMHAINVPRQGSGASERIGRQCTFDHIMVDCTVTAGPTGSYPLPTAVDGSISFANQRMPVPRSGFVALVLDKQNNALDPGPPLNSVFAPSAEQVQGMMGLKNLENSKRFEILDIKRYTLEQTLTLGPLVTVAGVPNVTAAYSGKAVRFQLNSSRKIITNFINSTGKASDIADTAVRLYWVDITPQANGGGPTDNYPTVTLMASGRARFRG